MNMDRRVGLFRIASKELFHNYFLFRLEMGSIGSSEADGNKPFTTLKSFAGWLFEDAMEATNYFTRFTATQ